jgi:hypothetical protein
MYVHAVQVVNKRADGREDVEEPRCLVRRKEPRGEQVIKFVVCKRPIR